MVGVVGVLWVGLGCVLGPGWGECVVGGPREERGRVGWGRVGARFKGANATCELL